MASTADKLFDFVAKRLGIERENVSEETEFKVLESEGALAALKELFEVDINEEDAQKATTAGDVLKLVRGGQTVEDKVAAIVAERMGVKKEDIGEQTAFVTDLGADSLDQVELMMELEDEFDLNIPDEDAENIATIGDAIKYIKEHA